MINSTLSFFEWCFEGMPQDHYIVGTYIYKFNRDSHHISGATNENFKDPKAATTFGAKCITNHRDTYFGLGMFANNWDPVPGESRVKFSRKKEDAKFFRVIAFDVDVGVNKPYEDFDAALGPVIKTLAHLGLTKPQYTIIQSGYGMHVYIRFMELVPRHDWEILGSKLKAFFKKECLYIDNSKIGEAAMILRPVGTYNFKDPKNPKLVRLRHWGPEDVSLEFLQVALEGYDADVKAYPTYRAAQNTLDFTGLDEITESVIAAGDLVHAKPVWQIVQKNCQQLSALAVDCKGKEPLRYKAVGIAAYTDEPREAAIAWTKSRDTFNENETLLKMDQWTRNATGPATCANFNELNPTGCEGCPFKGKITTPLHAKEAEPSIVVREGPKQKEFVLPTGYVFTKSGGIIKSTGTDDPFQVPVVDFEVCLDGMATKTDIRDPITFSRWAINLPRRGWTYLEVEMAAIFGGMGKGEGFTLKCAQLGIAMQKRRMNILQEYAIDCINHYVATRDIAKVISQMGWTEEGHFIYGCQEIKGYSIQPENVTPQGKSMIEVSKSFKQKGSLDIFLQQVQILSQPGLECHAFGYLLGFAAPLYKFTGLGGATVNFYSEHSGNGKTTACNCGLATYGKPTLMMGTVQDTVASNQAKMAALNNIPLLIDEISDTAGFKVSDMLYTASSGKQKATADRNSELKESKNWNTILMTTSNKSLYDKLDEFTTSASGQKNRLLQIELPDKALKEEEFKQINITLMNNYGLAADPYLNRLVEMYHDDDLPDKVIKSIDQFSDHFKFDFLGSERFIGGIFATAWLGAQIAIELGLCPNFDLDRIFNKILETVAKNRKQIESAVAPAEDVLSQFILTNNQHFVKVMIDDAAAQGSYLSGGVMYKHYEGSVPSGAIVGRYEARFKNRSEGNVPYSARIYIEPSAFKQFCRKANHPVYRYLEAFYQYRHYMKHSVNLCDGIKEAIDRSPVMPYRATVMSFDAPVQLLALCQSTSDVVLPGDEVRKPQTQYKKKAPLVVPAPAASDNAPMAADAAPQEDEDSANFNFGANVESIHGAAGVSIN